MINATNKIYEWLTEIQPGKFDAVTVQPTDRQNIPATGQTIRISGHRSKPAHSCGADIAANIYREETDGEALLQFVTYIGAGKDASAAELIAAREQTTALCWLIIDEIEADNNLKGTGTAPRFCEVQTATLYQDFANIGTNLFDTVFLELKLNPKES